MARKSKVDPDTGYTAEEQRAKAKEIFSSKKQQPKAKMKRKVHRNPVVEESSDSELKIQAVNLYEQGVSPKEVSKLLSISYASAYYYKRFVGAEVKKTRLKKSMQRV
jgi:hypothetical protein